MADNRPLTGARHRPRGAPREPVVFDAVARRLVLADLRDCVARAVLVAAVPVHLVEVAARWLMWRAANAPEVLRPGG